MPPEFDPTPGRAMIAAFAPGFAMPPEIEALAAALDRIEDLEDALIQERADSLTCAEYEPPMTMNGLRSLAREQLQTEGKL